MQRVLSRLTCRVGRQFTRIPLTAQQLVQIQSRQVPVFRCLSLSSRAMAFQAVEKGALNTLDYRVYFADAKGQPLSPFHDIPLFADKENNVYNMIVEIPRWSNAKMEISKADKLNPIKQDVKKGNLRYVKNVFPFHGYMWNYGALPQTWEDPEYEEKRTQTKGDQDPLDVCEIGSKVHARGSVIQVKPLAIMCLVDEEETDWKVLVIDVTDPLAEKLNDVADLEQEMPGFIAATREWFEIYKIPDGKPRNKFGLKGEALNKAEAVEEIEKAHVQWKKLMKNGSPDISIAHVTEIADVKDDSRISADEAMTIVKESPPVGAPQPLPADVDKCYFVPKL